MDLEQSFLHHLAPTTDSPMALTFSKARGIYLFDPQGNKYLDMFCAVGTSILGYNNYNVNKSVINNIKKDKTNPVKY